MTKTENFERIEMSSPDALRGWLEDHHGQAESVWLVTWKAATPEKYLSVDDVLDCLLAFGWIDGIRRKHPDDPLRTMQLIAPRKQQAWSQSYKDRVARLRTEGLMHPAGERVVQSGQQSGLWDFFADVDALIVPSDLDAALGADREKWDAYPDGYKRNVLRWIKLAKTDPTRTKRIAQTAQVTQQGGRIAQM